MAFSGSRDACPMVKNILLLDSEGKRVAVKYYSDDWPTNTAKLAFEKSLFAKTMKSNARTEGNFGRVASPNSRLNLLHLSCLHFILSNPCITTYFEVTRWLLILYYLFLYPGCRGTVDKREALENLDLIFLCLDEIVEKGMILETDANVIAGKVAINSMDPGAPLSEQTISQALATAREHLTRTLFQ
ncbi:zeta-coat protein, putative [Ricinus communis]|uniref:Coatomer subunit zeta n=1 Tax=Ricinus communis TaxID=3988 RepID=B9S5W1_RICCO|nr:zeta-coat protein, putative [Ricinus communis]